MRAVASAVLAASLVSFLAPATASADAPRPKPPIVWQNRVIPAPPAGAAPASALTTVSHKLYMNDCQPNGCLVTPGNDSSLTNRSSIPQTPVTLSPYGHGQEHWDRLVQCVRETFAPFDIEVVTTDPGPSVSHFEIMIGGSSQQLRPDLDAGGVAPFISCGATRNNVISFVFPETTADLEYLCGAVAQESCHVWGLDHELNAADPMTYLELGTLKRFQNDDANCGEALPQPRRCECGGPTQNSFRYLTNTFGLAANLPPAQLTLIRPSDRQWLRPGFPVNGTLDSPLGQLRAAYSIDGEEIASVETGPIAFNAPASVPTGDRELTLTATDNGDRTVTATVNVHVMASCAGGASCGKGFHCLGGVCYPSRDVAGGLGASCESNDDCATGSCGKDGTEALCTGACDAGATCPSGFECLAGANVCWPSESGGCSTRGGAPGGFVAFGLAALAFALRRRSARA